MPRIGDGRSAAQLERDSALHRIGLTRRFAIGAAAALTAGIAVLVSAVAPGRTLGATQYSAAYKAAYQRYLAARASATTPSTKMPPLASPSSLGLVAGAAPQPAPTQSQGPSASQQAQAQAQAQAAAAQAAAAQAAPVQVAAPPPVVVSGGS
jgi:hypothetical protein